MKVKELREKLDFYMKENPESSVYVTEVTDGYYSFLSMRVAVANAKKVFLEFTDDYHIGLPAMTVRRLLDELDSAGETAVVKAKNLDVSPVLRYNHDIVEVEGDEDRDFGDDVYLVIA